MFDSRKIPDVLAGLFLILLFLFISFPLPDFSGSPAGHALGIVGFLLMSWNLAYSYRKRVQHKRGRANPLNRHASYGLVGGLLVVAHAGTIYASPIGILVFLAMLLVIFSGVIGKILFRRVNKTLRGHEADLQRLETFFRTRRQEIDGEVCRRIWASEPLLSWTGLFEEEWAEEFPSRDLASCQVLADTAAAIAETEDTIRIYAATRRVFSFWIAVHIYGTFLLFAMAAVHILTTLYYGVEWTR